MMKSQFVRLSTSANVGAILSLAAIVVMAYWIPDSLGAYTFWLMLACLVIFAVCIGIRVVCTIIESAEA
jgi:hypothetical protein